MSHRESHRGETYEWTFVTRQTNRCSSCGAEDAPSPECVQTAAYLRKCEAGARVRGSSPLAGGNPGREQQRLTAACRRRMYRRATVVDSHDRWGTFALPPAGSSLEHETACRCLLRQQEVLTMTANPVAKRRPRPTLSEVAHEVGAVVADLPRFASAPLYRRHHQRWGATDEEVRASMPGDELISDVAYLATRAITIDAPPEAVWPWLVQVGCLKAGYYANDLLDNLGHRARVRSCGSLCSR